MLRKIYKYEFMDRKCEENENSLNIFFYLNTEHKIIAEKY